MGKVGQFWDRLTRIASAKTDPAADPEFARRAPAMLAGLLGPPVMVLSGGGLQWQIWACLALVAPLASLTRLGEGRIGLFLAPAGVAFSAAIALAASYPDIDGALAFLILTPLEVALIEAAARSKLGGWFPFVALFGFAIAERTGLTHYSTNLMVAAVLAPSAAVAVSLILRRRRPYWRARLRPIWSRAVRAAARAHSESELSVTVNAKGVALDVGIGCAELLRIEPDSLIGAGFFQRLNVADRPEFLLGVGKTLRGEAARPATMRLRSGDATPRAGDGGPRIVWVEVRMRRSTDPEVDTVVATLSDITEAKEAERRLGTAPGGERAAMSLKDRLLADVTHELRTPLNAILGFSEILATASLVPETAEQRIEYARIIHASAEHLLSLVDPLLDLSRLDAGHRNIAPEPFELAPLIRDCRDMLRMKAQRSGVEFVVEIPEGSCQAIADKRACRQILLNLMSNAVKFSLPGGRVTIEACVAEQYAVLSVCDAGVGIAKEHLPRIGDPFFQVNPGVGRAREGTGLGLSLVCGLVGLHGGALAIESAPGVGTRITVRLPLDCRSRPRDGAAAAFETIPRLNLTQAASRRRSEERRIA